MRRIISIIALVLSIMSSPVHAVDYPSGTTSSGLITSVQSFVGGMVRVTLTGTKGNGQPGAEAFWMDTNTQTGKSHYANLLAAAAQGKSIAVWHYGDQLDYGGQSGYQLGVVSVGYP